MRFWTVSNRMSSRNIKELQPAVSQVAPGRFNRSRTCSLTSVRCARPAGFESIGGYRSSRSLLADSPGQIRTGARRSPHGSRLRRSALRLAECESVGGYRSSCSLVADSPGQIRTAVRGSKGLYDWPLHHGAPSTSTDGAHLNTSRVSRRPRTRRRRRAVRRRRFRRRSSPDSAPGGR